MEPNESSANSNILSEVMEDTQNESDDTTENDKTENDTTENDKTENDTTENDTTEELPDSQVPENEDAEIKAEEKVMEESVVVCSKEDAISTVTTWYKSEFMKYLKVKGMISLKSCHEKIVKKLYDKTKESSSDSDSITEHFKVIGEYWEDVQEKLRLELENYEIIVEGINKAENLSVAQYSSVYEEEMGKFLTERITKENVRSLKPEIIKANEDFLNSCLKKMDERCHNMIRLHLVDATKVQLEGILGVEKVYRTYTDKMKTYFENFTCFSDEWFENYHRSASQTAVEVWHRNNLRHMHLDNHVLNITKQIYEVENREIRNTEMEIIVKLLENDDEYYLNNLQAKQVCRQADIQKFHERLTDNLIETVNKIFDVKKRGFNLDRLKRKLGERLPLWVLSNEKKSEKALKLINQAMFDAELVFTEAMKAGLSKKPMSLLEFEFLLAKQKGEAIRKMEVRLYESLLQKSRQKQIVQLQTKIDKLGKEFNEENMKWLHEEESKSCPTPILLIEFGVNFVKVGYVDGMLKMYNFDELDMLRNTVTFTTEGDYLIGKTSKDKHLEINIAKVVLTSTKGMYPETLRLPKKDIDIPIDLQFMSTLIFTHIKETVENKDFEFPSVLIVVPLWFATRHRLAIKNAASTVGFKQVFLLNDLSAAALVLSPQSKQRSISVSTLNLNATPKNLNQQILIISADECTCYAAVYQSEIIGDQNITHMLHNVGNFHMPLPQFVDQHTVQYNSTMIASLINLYPNIGQVIIRSEIHGLHAKYVDLIKSKIPTCSYRDMENSVLEGAAKYSEILADKISFAKNSLRDKTFYPLSFLHKIRTNDPIMKNNSDLNIPVDSGFTIKVEKIDVTIVESCRGSVEQVYGVEKFVYNGKIGDNIQIATTTTHEGYFEIHASKGSLLMKEERQKVCDEYKLIIEKHFQKDKEFELMRKSLTEIAEYMLQNISTVTGIMQDQIQEESDEALQLAKQPNAHKELVQEKILILEKFKSRYFSVPK